MQILNLFLALLLASFGSNVLRERENEEEDNKIGEAINRFQRCFRFLTRSFLGLFTSKRATVTKTSTPDAINNNRVCSSHLKIFLIGFFSYLSSRFHQLLKNYSFTFHIRMHPI